jgi:hypothetical protein
VTRQGAALPLALALSLSATAAAPGYASVPARSSQAQVSAQPRIAEPATSPELRPHHVQRPPAIDGVLDDEAWREPPLQVGAFKSYNPLHGDVIPQQTTVKMAYDAGYIYFAFRCDDPEPDHIKTSITRRDNIWSDDWVGFSIDALGTGQVSYHFMVNPNGVSSTC